MLKHQHSDCSGCTSQWWKWAKKQITSPIRGFKDKKNPDGSPFSFYQAQQATYIQIYWIIYDLCRRRKSASSIYSIVGGFIK